MANIIPAECLSVKLADALAYRHPAFVFEEKFDGVRALVEIRSGSTIVTGRRLNHAGEPCNIGPRADWLRSTYWHAALMGCVLDGELMPDGRFIAFDLLYFKWENLRSLALKLRRIALVHAGEFLPETCLVIAQSATPPKSFGEGVVVKDSRAKYGHGWFKAKRLVTFDLRVSEMLDHGVAIVEGHGKIQGVPETVKPGDVIEAEAFEMFPSGKLRNGRFLRVRDDK